MPSLSHSWGSLIAKTLLILTGLCAVWFQASLAATPAAQLPAQTILIVGDSLSSEYGIRRNTGWVQLLRERLKSHYPPASEVINASISGDTTSGGVSRLPVLLKKHQPTLVIVELGGNDALRGLSLEMTRANLTNMVVQSQQSGAKVILAGMQIPANYGPAYSEAFKGLYVDIAQQTDAELIPFLLAGLETDRSLFIEDGIHPAEQAQPILLENVWATLAPLLPID